MLSIHGRIVYQRPMPTVVASAYQQGNCYELLYVEEFLLPRLIVLQGRLVRAIDGWQLDHIVQWLDRDESSSHEESPGQGCASKRTTCFIQSACNESQSYEILDVAKLELYQYLREGRAIEDAATYSCDDTNDFQWEIVSGTIPCRIAVDSSQSLSTCHL
jgi:hypothetical protein